MRSSLYSLILFKTSPSRGRFSKSVQNSLGLDDVLRVLERCCAAVNIKRYDETSEIIEASFLVEFDDIAQLNQAKTELQGLDADVKITFLDTKSLMNY